MTLQLVVDSLDEVEEAHRGLYKEADGKFRLVVEGAEDVSGLKNTVDKLRAERDRSSAAARKLEKELSELRGQIEGLGDLDSIKEMLAQHEKEKEDRAREKGEFEKIQQEKHERAVRAKEQEIEALKQAYADLEGELKTHVRKARIAEGLNKAQAHPDYREFAEMRLERLVEIEKGEDGHYDAFVRDGETLKPVMEYIDAWVGTDEGQRFTRGPATNGGGADNVTGNSGAPNPWKTNDVLAQHRMFNENPERARAMMRAAGKA